MSARTEIVPFWWTTLDALGASAGADVTPYKIPAKLLNGCGGWTGGQVVQLPLGLSSEPASVARFFREGYEWIDVPDDVTSTTLGALLVELYQRDKVRFGHFDPLLITATTALRDVARIKEELGSHMTPKSEPVTGFPVPGWMTGLHIAFTALSIAAKAPEYVAYYDLCRLHFDYWGNSEWRMGFLGTLFNTYELPETWNFNIAGISPATPIPFVPLALPASGMNVGDSLLAAIVPHGLPLDADFAGTKIRMAKVLARKPLQGSVIRSMATQKGHPAHEMHVVSVEPPRIELDGWSTQNLVPFYLNTWKTGESKISFRITLPLGSLKTIIEIVHQRHVVYSEAHELGEFILPGVHTWHWNGYDNDGVFDSAVLKSNELTARVTVMDMQGRVSVATTELGTGPGGVRWTDVRVDTKLKTVDVSVFIHATKPSDFNIASFNFPLPKGAGDFLTKSIGELGENPVLSMVPLIPELGEKIPEKVDSPLPFLPVLPKESIPRLLNDDKLALTVPFPKGLDLDEYVGPAFKRELLFGIQERWSRDITLDDEPYRLQVHVSERASDAFWIILAAALPKALDNLFGTGNTGPINDKGTGSRSFNLSSFGEGLPILYIYDDLDNDAKNPINQRELGAHEFGHTVLREAYDPMTSCCHKGTSTPIGDDTDSQPAFGPTDFVGQQADIMLYYQDGHDFARTWATNDDARALAWMGKVAFG